MSDDNLLKRYLLGDLPEEETGELERRLLADGDLFELAEALESEVLEDYARGELTPAQRDRVARYLNASPEGRLRLAVIRGLASTASAERSRLLPFPKPVAVPLRPKQRAAAVAALLVMALGAIRLASIYVPGLPVKQAGLHVSPPPPPTRPETAATNPPPSSPLTATPAPPPVVFVATLALSSLRGEVEIQTVQMPPGTDRVELRMPLPAGDEGYNSYRVALSDGTGGEVTRREGLQAGRDDGQPVLAFQVDAGRLPAGRYALEIQGIGPEGDVEDLAFPEFEVR
jgi:anti-sigma factor RsiW